MPNTVRDRDRRTVRHPHAPRSHHRSLPQEKLGPLAFFKRWFEPELFDDSDRQELVRHAVDAGGAQRSIEVTAEFVALAVELLLAVEQLSDLPVVELHYRLRRLRPLLPPPVRKARLTCTVSASWDP